MKGESYIRAEVTFKARTNDAVLVAWGDNQEWFPRSCLSYSCDQAIESLKRNEDFKFEVAEWIALQKGLEY